MLRRSSTEARFISALDEHTGHSWLASVTQSQSRQSTAWTNGIADVFIRVDMAGLFQICCIRTRGWIPLPPMGEDSPMRVKICLPFVQWSANCLWMLQQACGAIRVRMRLFGRRPILRIPDLLTRSAPKCCEIPRRVVFKEVKHVPESIEITQFQNPGRFIDYASLKDCSPLGRSLLVAIHVITHSF